MTISAPFIQNNKEKFVNTKEEVKEVEEVEEPKKHTIEEKLAILENQLQERVNIVISQDPICNRLMGAKEALMGEQVKE